MRRITHPTLAFSLEVPTEWQITVAQDDEGPLQVFGITLLKRITRPGPRHPYTPDDPAPWNRLLLRGGASTGLNIIIRPPETGIATEQDLEDARRGKAFGIPVTSLDKNIDITGFTGQAAIRELPAGNNVIGFGYLANGVLSRQWWLRGQDDLQLEILGIAPADSPTLKETIDRVLQSLRPG